MKTALLVIDVQQVIFESPRYDGEAVVQRINRLADEVRRRDGSVIFIQHNGSAEDDLAEGCDGWQLYDQLEVRDGDSKMTKTACDAFYETPLEQKLQGVDEVLICGCVTEFCVDTTLRSCLSKGFDVTAVSDAHTTGDREHLDAKSIIDHHNATWKDLILPGARIRVPSTDELIGSMSPLD